MVQLNYLFIRLEKAISELQITSVSRILCSYTITYIYIYIYGSCVSCDSGELDLTSMEKKAYSRYIIHCKARSLTFPCTNSMFHQLLSRFFSVCCWRNNVYCFLIGDNIPDLTIKRKISASINYNLTPINGFSTRNYGGFWYFLFFNKKWEQVS